MSHAVQTGIIVVLGVLVGAGLIWTHSGHHHSDDATVSSAGNHLVLYSSTHEGLAFEYPDTATTTFHHEGPEDADWHVLTVVDKQALASSTDPYGESVPAIVILGAFEQPQGMSLEAWLRANPSHSTVTSSTTFASTTVGGEPALAYTYDGLYMTDAVAVAHESGIYIFTAQWGSAADPIRTQFQDLLKTIAFIP